MTVENPLSKKSFDFRSNFDFFEFESIKSHLNFESLTFETIKQTLTIEKINSKIVQPFQHYYSRILIYLIYFALIIWSSVELITSLFYLTKYKFLFHKDGEIQCLNCHLGNFLNPFCDKPNKCLEYLKYGLFYRAVAGAFLLAGTISKSTFLMVPWFLNIAVGIFPMGPMFLSVEYTYIEIKQNMSKDHYSDVWKFFYFMYIENKET